MTSPLRSASVPTETLYSFPRWRSRRRSRRQQDSVPIPCPMQRRSQRIGWTPPDEKDTLIWADVCLRR